MSLLSICLIKKIVLLSTLADKLAQLTLSRLNLLFRLILLWQVLLLLNFLKLLQVLSNLAA